MKVPSFEAAGGPDRGHGDLNGLHYEAIAARSALQDWTFAAHSHGAVNQVFWITRGGGRVVMDGITRGFSTYTAILIPAGCVHGFDFTLGTMGHVVSLPQAPDLNLPDHPALVQLSSPQDQQNLTALIGGIRDEYRETKPGREAALKAHAMLLSVHVARLASRVARPEREPTASEELMQRFSGLIEERFRSQTALKDYAEALDITPTHLTRVCQSAAGRTASELVQERVLLEARRMLAFTDHRINDIATELGFSDPAYFTRLFASKTGQPPSAFRKAARAGSIAH